MHPDPVNPLTASPVPAAARRDVLDLPEPVVIALENVPGMCGPAYAVIKLRSGWVIEAGDEGILLYAPETYGHTGPVFGAVFHELPSAG